MRTTLGRAASGTEAAVARGVSMAHPVFIERAENALLWDADGCRYVDFAGGIAVLNTGHRHPRVLEAVRAQLERVTHTCFQVTGYEPYVALCERLNRLAPGPGPNKTLLMTTGAEAIENAVKIARASTGRSAVISFAGGFHGRTLMALALTGKIDPYKAGFGPYPAEVYHAPFPNALHGVSSGDAFDALAMLFKCDIAPDRVAAIVFEPVQGEGGFHVAPKDFVLRLRELCDRHGILLVADEIQSGAGRTGRMFASEHWGVQPDIITIGKGIASGVPMGAIVAPAEVMDWPGGAHANTFGGNPIACEAALVTIKLLEKKFIANAARIGGYLLEELKKMQPRHRLIGDVRGKGLLIGVELVRDPMTKDEAVRERNDLVQRCFEKGLLLLGAGHCVVRFIPPLMITKQEADRALEIFDDVLTEIEQH